MSVKRRKPDDVTSHNDESKSRVNNGVKLTMVIVFILSIVLTLTGAILTKINNNSEISGGGDLTKPPIPPYEKPSYDRPYLHPIEIEYPEIESNLFVDSIESYDGVINQEEFKGIFEENFFELFNEGNTSNTEFNLKYIFDDEYKDGIKRISIEVSVKERIIDNTIITNPQHTYRYKVTDMSLV